MIKRFKASSTAPKHKEQQKQKLNPNLANLLLVQKRSKNKYQQKTDLDGGIKVDQIYIFQLGTWTVLLNNHKNSL